MEKICTRIAWLLVSLIVFQPRDAFAQRDPSEYEVKAAFLYHFLKYVEWPPQTFPDAASPLTIGVLGDDPFGNLLENSMAGKSINQRKIVVRRSTRLEDLKTCHLLFISQSEKGRIKKILSDLKGTKVMTVSEFDSFAEQGGMFNFTLSASKVRFEINLNAVQSAGLKVSSKLLNVAKIVTTEPRVEIK